MAETSLYLVAYDIASDKRRNRVAKELLNFGDRVQESVFECRISLARLEVLLTRVAKRLDASEDTLRVYRLCAECAPQVRTIGRQTAPPPDEDILII